MLRPFSAYVGYNLCRCEIFAKTPGYIIPVPSYDISPKHYILMFKV